MNDDATLLRRYTEESSESAFTELVRRYVDLVYSAALRRTGGDSHGATEVAQQVFTALARDARKLSSHPVLAAWLHTATRNASINLMISEQRRKAREAEVLALESDQSQVNPDWDRVRPLLDAAIDELPEPDRAAVVLRYLERRPFTEIGMALKISEDAARMRADRALDKLRSTLARRGVTSTATAFGAVLAGLPLISAPTGLASALASQSLALAGPGFFATVSASFMTTKLIATVVLSSLVGFWAGTTIDFNQGKVTRPLESPRESKLIASLRHDSRQQTSTIAALNAEIARLNDANAGLVAQAEKSNISQVAKRTNFSMPRYELQGAIVNNLKLISGLMSQYALERGTPPRSLADLVGVGRYTKTLRSVGGEDYSVLAMNIDQPLTVVTPDGESVTFDPKGVLTTQPVIPPAVELLQKLSLKVHKPIQNAYGAYAEAHYGMYPPNEEAILPYFRTPEEGADYVEYLKARKPADQ